MFEVNYMKNKFFCGLILCIVAFSFAESVLAAEFIWGEDLNAVPGLTDMLTADLELIQNEGMRAAVKSVIS